MNFLMAASSLGKYPMRFFSNLSFPDIISYDLGLAGSPILTYNKIIPYIMCFCEKFSRLMQCIVKVIYYFSVLISVMIMVKLPNDLPFSDLFENKSKNKQDDSPMIPPLFGKQEVGIWRVKKCFPRYGVPIWSLWPNIRSLPSIVAEKNVTKNVHICSMCIETN